MLKKGEVLYNLNDLGKGKKLKIYSDTVDVFQNECVEIYTIEKIKGSFMISMRKKIGEGDNDVIEFKDMIATIGVSAYLEENIRLMKTLPFERQQLECVKHIEENLIRRGYSVEGRYKGGQSFVYPNIIHVEEVS